MDDNYYKFLCICSVVYVYCPWNVNTSSHYLSCNVNVIHFKNCIDLDFLALYQIICRWNTICYHFVCILPFVQIIILIRKKLIRISIIIVGMIRRIRLFVSYWNIGSELFVLVVQKYYAGASILCSDNRVGTYHISFLKNKIVFKFKKKIFVCGPLTYYYYYYV